MLSLLKLAWFGLSKLINVFLEILASTIKHWRIFLPLAIVTLALWRFNVVLNQRDDARAQYANHLADDKAAAETRRQENTAKFLKASAQIVLSNYQHQSEISILKGRYENKMQHDKAAAAASINNWRERVRLEVARNTTAYGLPSNTSNTSGSTEGKSDCDTTAAGQAYENLELACAITTSDYNSLRRWADNTCKIFGCTE
jgi:hypothetical protein